MNHEGSRLIGSDGVDFRIQMIKMYDVLFSFFGWGGSGYKTSG